MKRLIGGALIIFVLIINALTTHYFGYNLLPKSIAEGIVDLFLVLFMTLGFILLFSKPSKN